jgi:hypothetical protein
MNIPSLLQTKKQKQIDQALQLFFTDWQIKIIAKRLTGSNLDASERVEYSKCIKKIFKAVRALQDLASLLD